MRSLSGLRVTRELTEALASPWSPPASVDLDALRSEIATGFVQSTEGSGGRLRINAFTLGTARSTSERPFSWSPRCARRAVGIAAVRASLLDGTFGGPPGPAVHRAIARMRAEAHVEGAAARTLPGWLSTLPAPMLTAVEAEATTWATHLLASFDWPELLPHVVVGGPDRWWDSPRGTKVALRGRVDVSVTTPVGRSTVTLLPGWPRPTAALELGLAPLVDLLNPARRDGIPGRVAGWWPESGRALVIDVDCKLLEETASAVLDVAGRRQMRPDRAAA